MIKTHLLKRYTYTGVHIVTSYTLFAPLISNTSKGLPLTKDSTALLYNTSPFRYNTNTHVDRDYSLLSPCSVSNQQGRRDRPPLYKLNSHTQKSPLIQYCYPSRRVEPPCVAASLTPWPLLLPGDDLPVGGEGEAVGR